jgi:hypothetical protein
VEVTVNGQYLGLQQVLEVTRHWHMARGQVCQLKCFMYGTSRIQHSAQGLSLILYVQNHMYDISQIFFAPLFIFCFFRPVSFLL